MGGDDDRAALLAPGGELAQERRPRRRVQACEGLVEQHDLGLLGLRLRQQRALALASGEVAEAPLGERRDPEAFDRVVHQLAVALAEAAPVAELPVAAHAHHVADGDREGGLQVESLGNEGDALRAHLDRPGGRLQQADGGPEQGRLARAVRAQQRDSGARGDLEADALERVPPADPDGQLPRDDAHFARAQRSQSPWITTSWALIEWRSRPASRARSLSRRSSSNAVTRPQRSQTA